MTDSNTNEDTNLKPNGNTGLFIKTTDKNTELFHEALDLNGIEYLIRRLIDKIDLKQDKLTGEEGQIPVIGPGGDVTTTDPEEVTGVCQVNLESNNNGGILTGEGSVFKGESKTVNATAKDTFNFIEWTDKSTGEVVSTEPEYTFEVNKNTTLLASFTQDEIQTNIPEGYTEVEYIYNPELAFIQDIDDPNGWFIAHHKIRLEFDILEDTKSGNILGTDKYSSVSCPPDNSIGNRTIWNLYYDTNTNKFTYQYIGNIYQGKYDGSTAIDYTAILDASEHNVIILDYVGKQFTVNDNTIETSYVGSNTKNPRTDISACLFGKNMNSWTGVMPGSTTTTLSYGISPINIKLIRFTAYNADDTIAMDLVPCRRNTDSKAGLYDVISEKFYTNTNDINKGVFYTGPIINNTIPKYTVNIVNPLPIGGSIKGAGESNELIEGSTITLSVSTKPGYKFGGWKDQNGNILSSATTYTHTVAGDITITADIYELVVKIPTDSGFSQLEYISMPQGCIIEKILDYGFTAFPKGSYLEVEVLSGSGIIAGSPRKDSIYKKPGLNTTYISSRGSIECNGNKIEFYCNSASNYGQYSNNDSVVNTPVASLNKESGKMSMSWKSVDYDTDKRLKEFKINNQSKQFNTTMTNSGSANLSQIGSSKINLKFYFYKAVMFKNPDSSYMEVYPAIRNSDGKVGVYDIIKKKFLYPTSIDAVAGPSLLPPTIE